jgi:hypothetical protein
MLKTVRHAFRRSHGMHRVCGMHALGKVHVIRDCAVLRIADYHPHRVAIARSRASSAQSDDTETVDDPAEERSLEWERPDDTPRIPYVEKDIPLPDGLRPEQVRCVLGEDAVFLIKVGCFVPPLPSTLDICVTRQKARRGTDGLS